MITCSRCGWENDAQDRVCAGCGAGLDGTGAAAAPPHRPDPVAPAPPPAPAPPAVVPPADRGPDVPQRTIPVRVAPRTSAHAPAAGSEPPRAEPRVPGQIGCRLCGRSLPAGRRFCACGAALSVVEPERPHAPARPPSWWREWSAHRTHRAAMRQATGGGAPRYDVPVAPHVRIVRVGIVLLLVAVIGSQVGPWGDDLRQLVVERITMVVGSAITRPAA